MLVEKEYEYFLLTSHGWASPDPAQCGKPTALGTPFFFPWLGYKLPREKHNSENLHSAHKNVLQ